MLNACEMRPAAIYSLRADRALARFLLACINKMIGRRQITFTRAALEGLDCM